MKIRTRFAPSPTGYMHVGNLRTALYAYLLAKKEDGTFILRIEDTDRERLVEGATDIIYNTLKAAGLNWDEGPDVGGDYGPYIQSERMDLYKKYALQLVQSGHAYYCFCDRDRLVKIKEIQAAAGRPPMYDGHCLKLTADDVAAKLDAGDEYVIRQKMPRDGKTSFIDSVFGEISVDNAVLEDQVLIKADGMPTYNFANVVDDHVMAITHVVRGNEYLSSTPKYNLLYEAFGWDIPVYVHCSPIMKNQKEKLSKRNGDASYQDLVEKGYLTDAIINYIALLGWSPGGENEIFDLQGLVEAFDVSGISKSPAIFDQQKLNYINAEYLRAMSPEQFKSVAMPFITKSVSHTSYNIDCLIKVLQKRVEVLGDISEQVDFIDALPQYDSEMYIHKKMKTSKESSLLMLKEILPALENMQSVENEVVHSTLMGLAKSLEVKNGYLLWPLRTALSGKSFTPGGGTDLIEILGKDESIKRVKMGIEKLSAELSA